MGNKLMPQQCTPFNWQEQFEIVDSNLHDNFLNIRAINTREEYIGKEIISTSAAETTQIQTLITKKINQPSPHALKLIWHHQNNQMNYCSYQYKFHLAFEKYSLNLKEQKIKRQFSYQQFQEEEVLEIIISVVEGLIYFKALGQPHQRICLQNILLRDNRTVCLSDPWLYNKQYNSIYTFHLNGFIYPSPEKILYENDMIDSYDPFLSDYYSLGATALELLFQQQMDIIYQKGFRKILQDKIAQMIARITNKQLKINIKILLSYDPQERSKIQTVNKNNLWQMYIKKEENKREINNRNREQMTTYPTTPQNQQKQQISIKQTQNHKHSLPHNNPQNKPLSSAQNQSQNNYQQQLQTTWNSNNTHLQSEPYSNQSHKPKIVFSTHPPTQPLTQTTKTSQVPQTPQKLPYTYPQQEVKTSVPQPTFIRISPSPNPSQLQSPIQQQYQPNQQNQPTQPNQLNQTNQNAQPNYPVSQPQANSIQDQINKIIKSLNRSSTSASNHRATPLKTEQKESHSFRRQTLQTFPVKSQNLSPTKPSPHLLSVNSQQKMNVKTSFDQANPHHKHNEKQGGLIPLKHLASLGQTFKEAMSINESFDDKSENNSIVIGHRFSSKDSSLLNSLKNQFKPEHRGSLPQQMPKELPFIRQKSNSSVQQPAHQIPQPEQAITQQQQQQALLSEQPQFSTPQTKPKNQRYNSTIKQVSEQQRSIESLQNDYQEKVVQYDVGTKYVGQVKNNKRWGKGIFYFQDNSYYEGQWKDNKMHGKGSLHYSNGSLAYQGGWYMDTFHGKGRIYNDQPVALARQFDYKNMSNEFIDEYWYSYEGDFFFEQKHGKGKLKLSNGESYAGEFNQDKIHGKGKFYTLNGQVIQGKWSNGFLLEQYV